MLSVKRVREKYEAELRELERSEQAALEKYQEMKRKQTEMEGELLRLQSLLVQKEQEITDLTQVNDAMIKYLSTMCTNQGIADVHTHASLSLVHLLFKETIPSPSASNYHKLVSWKKAN